jgi:YesN/AraC family two-component response regulator
MIRLLLVDDQPAVRRGLGMRLHMEPDIEIVGEAGTGREALRLAQELAPDVVLMDVEMPEMACYQSENDLSIKQLIRKKAKHDATIY